MLDLTHTYTCIYIFIPLSIFGKQLDVRDDDRISRKGEIKKYREKRQRISSIITHHVQLRMHSMLVYYCSVK